MINLEKTEVEGYPLVSVIMPLYNIEEYIEETLESLMLQTLDNFEVIMVDDGSIDSTAALAHIFEEKDHRFRLIRQDNKGAAVARNHGMAYARGTYLIFLDSDDIFDHQMLESMSKAISQNNVDVCVCDSVGFDSETGRSIEEFHTLGNVSEGRYLTSNLTNNIFQLFEGVPWDKMYRRSFIESNGYEFQNLRKSNDNFFSYANLVNSQSIYVIRRKFVHYRCNAGNSIQDNVSKNNLCILKAVDRLNKIKIPERASNSLATWSFTSYLHAFELSCTQSESTAYAIFNAFRSYYKRSWGLDKIKSSSLVNPWSRIRFWCESRLSFKGLYCVYRSSYNVRYNSYINKIMRLTRMIILALFRY